MVFRPDNGRPGTRNNIKRASTPPANIKLQPKARMSSSAAMREFFNFGN